MKKLIPLLLLITACNTQKRQIEKLQIYSVKYPSEFKTLAAVLAPCIDVNPKSDTIYRSKTDTLITAGRTDTLRKNDTVFITKQLPGRTIYKTNTETVTKTVADSRAVNACEILNRQKDEQIIKVETQLQQKSEAKKTWMWIAIGCMAVIVVFSVIKIYTFVSGGAIKSLLK